MIFSTPIQDRRLKLLGIEYFNIKSWFYEDIWSVSVVVSDQIQLGGTKIRKISK